MVPLLLAHLNIAHISLASHSGGDIYLVNTLLTYPYLLHPETPYVCFFAPWVVRTALHAAKTIRFVSVALVDSTFDFSISHTPT